jgi:hypothetical protein
MCLYVREFYVVPQRHISMQMVKYERVPRTDGVSCASHGALRWRVGRHRGAEGAAHRRALSCQAISQSQQTRGQRPRLS